LPTLFLCFALHHKKRKISHKVGKSGKNHPQNHPHLIFKKFILEKFAIDKGIFRVTIREKLQNKPSRRAIMLSRTKFNELLENVTGISRHTFDKLAVKLQKAKLIKGGGRGPHGVKIAGEGACSILLAGLAFEKANSSPEMVTVYLGLKEEGGTTLDEALSHILGNRGIAQIVDKISVCRTRPEATIYYGREKSQKVVKFEQVAGGIVGDTTYSAENERLLYRVDVTIDGEALELLAEFVAGDLKDPADFGALKRNI
jgi:hypothetical protein